MPQSKKYDNAAQRQAAYRQRKGREVATQSQMARLAICLCIAIDNAKECATLPLPIDLVADKPEQTLRNLIRFLDPIWDPVTNPTGRFRRFRHPYRIEQIDPSEPDDYGRN